MHIKKKNFMATTEKPIRKRRRSRDKPGRMAREKENADMIVTEDDPIGVTFINGRCETLSCEEEQACVQRQRNNVTAHYCVCTSNGEEAKKGVKCPRSTVGVTLINGRCETLSCEEEQACVQRQRNNVTAHYCVCTSNGEEAKKGVKCPRSTVGETFVYGRCETLSCEEEQACVQRQRNNVTTHYCVCTSNGEEAKKGVKCPRSTVGGTFINGRCETLSCEEEQACVQRQRNNVTTHYCVCTSNGEEAKKGVKCPRSTVPLNQRQAIHNLIPPQPSNATKLRHTPPTAQDTNSLVGNEIYAEATVGSDTAILDASTYYTNASAPLLVSMVAGCGLLLILVTVLIFIFKKRLCNVERKVKPRVRPGEPLLAERYITNPQYGVCGAGNAAPSAVPGTPAPFPSNKVNQSEVTILDRSTLTFLEEVGEGCFGKVYKGVLRYNNGEREVAIKVLKESAGRSAEEDFVSEVSIMSAFHHPNILTLIGVVYKGETNISPWMVFEYMEWGDLAGVLRGSRCGGRAGPILDEAALLQVALQVARGMQYLASRRFVHRDLAARNCLVGANLAVKIADFGMSRDVYTCDYYKMGGERPMPVRWMSPESIVYARFTHESDVWSYGVVLWEIYTRGKQPFYGCNNEEATKRIVKGILLIPPDDCPYFAGELMRASWAIDPRDRIGFDEICTKLEVAQAAEGTSIKIRLPRPPAAPLDSGGYLVPITPPLVDYLKPLPDSDFSEDEDDDDDDDVE